MGWGVAFAQTPDFPDSCASLCSGKDGIRPEGFASPLVLQTFPFSPEVDAIETSKTNVILSYFGSAIGIGEA